MVLLGFIGGLTAVTVVSVWAVVRLIMWDLQTERDVPVGRITHMWTVVVVLMTLGELGPGIGKTIVQAVSAIL